MFSYNRDGPVTKGNVYNLYLHKESNHCQEVIYSTIKM